MALAGNVALVTGSSRQMGRVIALALAAQGANVVINGVTDQAAIDSTVAPSRARVAQRACIPGLKRACSS